MCAWPLALKNDRLCTWAVGKRSQVVEGAARRFPKSTAFCFVEAAPDTVGLAYAEGI
jgi:hypothetical protein